MPVITSNTVASDSSASFPPSINSDSKQVAEMENESMELVDENDQ